MKKWIFLMSLALVGTGLVAQVITGSITGNVVDSSGGAVAEAKATLTSEATGEVQVRTANSSGTFNFAAVQPGGYGLKIEHAGFKVTEHKGIRVAATDRVSLGEIRMQVGAVSETITVLEESVHVATDSSQVSAGINKDQLLNLTARGREVVSLLRTIPGVTYQADPDSAGGTFGQGTPAILGSSSNVNHIAVDGVTSNDQGSPNVFSSVTSLDAIGEVKVLLNSYQAEYAGNGGAIVQVVTKGGGKEWHGSAYDFIRNDALNANDFFNNRSLVVGGVRRPRYRYNTPGATLGGPIYIPGRWNTSKTLLFGFYNIDIQKVASPGALTNYTMPSALERKGDFSNTRDLNNAVILIKDPTTGQNFPGNVIPSSRLNANGLALMNTLPLPNYDSPEQRIVAGGNYNYQIQEIVLTPKRSQLFKVDYVPTDKDRLYVRGKTYLSENRGYAVSSGARPIGFFGQCYCFTESGLAVVGTHIFSPTVLFEYNTGVRHNHEAWHPYGENGRTDEQELAKVSRSAIGFNLGQWYPNSNPEGWIPTVTWGVTSSPNITYDSRFLKGGTDFVFNLDGALSITRGNHQIKTGASFLREREYEGELSTFAGAFDFSKNTSNPLDSNYGFSNAALGVFNNYRESNTRYGGNLRQSTFEAYLQDTWRVTRRLTLNLGVRLSWAQQAYGRYDGQLAQFTFSRYDASQAPPLFRPALVNGVRQAQNPLTGAVLPAAYIGVFVPGVGDPAPGGVLSGDKNFPRGFINPWGVLPGPRFGFAWDPTGSGKTAIRGGAAILYTLRVSKWGNFTQKPPAVFTPITNYGDMKTLLATAGLLSPGSTSGYGLDDKAPDTYSLSFGIQQDLGRSFLLDVSYASTLGQHLPGTTSYNTLPLGARFLPQNADPSNGNRPLPDQFFRPYAGYSTINISNNAYNSNYHSMLLTINRRFAAGLRMGISYTLSKYLDYSGIPTYNNLRTWSYGFNGADARHNVVFNYTYDFPLLSRLKNSGFVRFVGDGWSVSGISQFVSGTPAGISFSTVQGTDLTGGGDGQRVQVVGDPNSNGSTFSAWFNQAAFALPPGNSSGTASKNSVRNPGVNNNDLVAAKRFNLKSESRYIQFRWEAYNVLNHTQYSGINTAARFDLTTGAQTNATFGQVTSTRTPRIMQGVLRFVF